MMEYVRLKGLDYINNDEPRRPGRPAIYLNYGPLSSNDVEISRDQTASTRTNMAAKQEDGARVAWVIIFRSQVSFLKNSDVLWRKTSVLVMCKWRARLSFSEQTRRYTNQSRSTLSLTACTFRGLIH